MAVIDLKPHSKARPDPLAVFRQWWMHHRAERERRRVLSQLRQLSETQLDDIGLSHANIDSGLEAPMSESSTVVVARSVRRSRLGLDEQSAPERDGSAKVPAIGQFYLAMSGQRRR